MAHGRISMAMQQVWHRLRPVESAEQTDRRMLRRFQDDKDENAFATLVQRHGPMVFGVCRRVLNEQDAEDAFQATFLLLAIKTKEVQWRDSIAGWLQQAAYRISAKARVRAARRRKHESQVEPMQNWQPPESGFGEVLDKELSRLPEKYRLPLVLCYLEGKTNEEAAVHLRWPVGTVAGRLARARELLRQRLGRRGLAYAAAAIGPLLQQHTAPAAVPAGLLTATVQAGGIAAAGEWSSAVDPSISELVQGALHEMFYSKLKMAGLTLAAVFGVCFLSYQLFGGSAAAVPAPAKAEVEAKSLAIIARAPLGGKISPPKFRDPSQQRVIRSNADLKKFGLDAADLARRLKVKAIDFQKHMLIHVTSGTKSSGGYRVEITRVIAKGKTIAVYMKQHSPGAIATAAITHPGEIVLVDRVDGKVTIQREAVPFKFKRR